MPSLGSPLSFPAAGRDVAGYFVIEESGRCLVLLNAELAHSTKVVVEGTDAWITWVRSAAVRHGVLSAVPEQTRRARAVLASYLSESPEVFESPVEEEPARSRTADRGGSALRAASADGRSAARVPLAAVSFAPNGAVRSGLGQAAASSGLGLPPPAPAAGAGEASQLAAIERLGNKLGSAVEALRLEVREIREGHQTLEASVEGLRRTKGADDHSLRMPKPSSGDAHAVTRGLSATRHLWFENLEEEAEEEDEDDDEDMLRRARSARRGRPSGSSSGRESTSGADLSSLVNIEVLKELRKMRRRRGDSEESDSEDEERGGDFKGFHGLESLRRKYRRAPQRLTNEYEDHCKKILKVSDARQVWCYRDVSDKLRKRFGRMVGLWRCHAGLQEVIQLCADKQFAHAHAFAAQLAKALHQVAIDGGSWESASLMLPLPDALQEPSFGGSERELAAVHSYRKAMKDLRSKHAKLEGDEDTEDDEGTTGPAASKGAKKKAALAKKKAAEEAKKSAAAAGGGAAGGKPST